MDPGHGPGRPAAGPLLGRLPEPRRLAARRAGRSRGSRVRRAGPAVRLERPDPALLVVDASRRRAPRRTRTAIRSTAATTCAGATAVPLAGRGGRRPPGRAGRVVAGAGGGLGDDVAQARDVDTGRRVAVDPQRADHDSSRRGRRTSDDDAGLTTFTRRRGSGALRQQPAARRADARPGPARRARAELVAATDPPLPPGRRVLVSGTAPATGDPVAEPPPWPLHRRPAGAHHDRGPRPRPGRLLSTRRACACWQRRRRDPRRDGRSRCSAAVDGTAHVPAFQPRRAPLTYVRADDPDGAASTARRPRRRRGLDAGAVAGRGRPAGPGVRPAPGRGRRASGSSLGDGVHGARPADRRGERHRHLPGRDR